MKSKASKLLSRFLVLIVFLLIGLIALKSNMKLRNYIYEKVFQNNIKFAKIDEIYEKYFGSALPLESSNIKTVSSEKIKYKSLEKYKNGVKLKVDDNYTVTNVKTGIVTFIGEKEEFGNSIIVEDSDGVEIMYSSLKDIKVGMYDYVKSGEIIGSVDGILTIQFAKDGKKVDYKKYI